MFSAKSAKRRRPRLVGLSEFESSFLVVVAVVVEVCGFVSSMWKFASVRWMGDEISASSPPKNYNKTLLKKIK